jgi:hypothetical protein
LEYFDQGTEIERPRQRRARSLERDHRALLITNRGSSEFQSLLFKVFKGFSGWRARFGGDYVAHLDEKNLVGETESKSKWSGLFGWVIYSSIIRPFRKFRNPVIIRTDEELKPAEPEVAETIVLLLCIV